MYYPFLWNTYSKKRIRLCQLCFDNNDKEVQKILQNTMDYNAIELMILVLHGDHLDLRTFNIIASLLTIDNVNTVSYVFNNEEHTLLTYCLKQYNHNDRMKLRVKTLLDCGADWNQIVGGVTALSYIVSTHHIDFLQWCISMGADITKGNLLVHASCWLTEENYTKLYHKFIEDNTHYDPEYQLTRFYTPVYTNDTIFEFLVNMGLDVNEPLQENGMTPLLAACCEGNLVKVETLLLAGASITAQSTDGMTVWSWSKRHMVPNQDGQSQYLLYDLLFSYWKKEKQFYIEMISECIMDKDSILSSLFYQLGSKLLLDGLICNIQDMK